MASKEKKMLHKGDMRSLNRIRTSQILKPTLAERQNKVEDLPLRTIAGTSDFFDLTALSYCTFSIPPASPWARLLLSLQPSLLELGSAGSILGALEMRATVRLEMFQL